MVVCVLQAGGTIWLTFSDEGILAQHILPQMNHGVLRVSTGIVDISYGISCMQGVLDIRGAIGSQQEGDICFMGRLHGIHPEVDEFLMKSEIAVILKISGYPRTFLVKVIDIQLITLIQLMDIPCQQTGYQ